MLKDDVKLGEVRRLLILPGVDYGYVLTTTHGWTVVTVLCIFKTAEELLRTAACLSSLSVSRGIERPVRYVCNLRFGLLLDDLRTTRHVICAFKIMSPLNLAMLTDSEALTATQ